MNTDILRPVPCPKCGSTNIGVKDMIIATPWRGEARKAWAYCRSCGCKGPETVMNIEVTDKEEINEAYISWNRDGQIIARYYSK